MPLPFEGGASRTQALKRGLCPQCRQGRIFAGRGRFGMPRMNPRCPVCDLKFEREQGYFLGAMYISYALMLPLLLLFLGLLWAFTDWDWWLRFVVAIALLLPFAPLLATVSRVLWIHFDRAVDPER